MYQTDVGSTSEIRPVAEAQQFSPRYNDSFLEGVIAQVKLLLKIIQDHKDARNNKNDGRKMFRVAIMLTILDNIRSRIQRCQFKPNRTEADMGPSSSNSDRKGKQQYNGEDDKEKLRQALDASMAARKSLELQCANLAKDKKIISFELAKRTHLFTETEELINDLKARHQLLTKKVKKCASEHRDKSSSSSNAVRERQERVIRMERKNEVIVEQIMITIDKYRSVKKKEKKLLEKNTKIRGRMEEITGEVEAALERFNGLKESMASRTDAPANIRDEITRLQHFFEFFQGIVLN